jgi:hypothetical protein
MRTFDVCIEGTSPILLHNPAGMARSSAVKRDSKSIPTPEEEAKASCFWMPDGSSLMFPGDNIQSAMIRVAGSYKANKKSLTPFVAGSIQIAPSTFPSAERSTSSIRAVPSSSGRAFCGPAQSCSCHGSFHSPCSLTMIFRCANLAFFGRFWKRLVGVSGSATSVLKGVGGSGSST